MSEHNTQPIQKTGISLFGGAKKPDSSATDNAAKERNNITSLVAADCVLKGDILSHSGYKVDGKVIGNINILCDKSSLLLISENAFVEGDIEAPRILINGHVKGMIRAREIKLGATSNVEGELQYERIVVAEGAELVGLLRKFGEDHAVEVKDKRFANALGGHSVTNQSH